ncbi:MAG TPA: energy transducer TonB, partial [Sphingomonas sp.]|nr:energy transducer TonB [Sphingomonas sp.]
WISPDDYPAEALKAGQEGNVRVTLDIGPDGAPRACRIDESSGVAVLDEGSCAVLMARARFQPPKSRDGKPTEANFTRNIRWVIPGTAEPDWVWVKLAAVGERFACSAEVGGKVRKLTDRVCQALGESVKKSGGSLDAPAFALLPDDPRFLKPAEQ